MKQLKILYEDVIYTVRQVWIRNKYGCQGVELNIGSMYLGDCKDEDKLKNEKTLQIWIDTEDRTNKDGIFKSNRFFKNNKGGRMSESKVHNAIASGETIHYTLYLFGDFPTKQKGKKMKKEETKRTIIYRGKEVVDCRWFDYQRGSVDIDCPFVRAGSFKRCEDCPNNG